MNLSRAARGLAWAASHPECRAHPLAFSVRALRWEWYRMRGKSVSMPLFDFRIEARPSDGMGRLVWYFRDRADTLFAFMKRYLRPGMTFVDVGANIGSHTLYGSRLVSSRGKVFSFEADPATFSLLEANVRLNRASNVALFNHCISNKRGIVSFNINADSARNSLVRGGRTQISLSANTLDDLLPADLHVDFLKIDVEGGDWLVLEGARRIFRKNPPRVVVIEVTTRQKEIKDFLSANGYRLYHVDHADSRFVEVKHPVFDTFAVRDCIRHELADFSFSMAADRVAGQAV